MWFNALAFNQQQRVLQLSSRRAMEEPPHWPLFLFQLNTDWIKKILLLKLIWVAQTRWPAAEASANLIYKEFGPLKMLLTCEHKAECSKNTTFPILVYREKKKYLAFCYFIISAKLFWFDF